MRILFYLPVVTPWWFAEIVLPLIEKLSAVAEIDVLAPLPWRGTGIGQAEIDLCAHLPQIRWHIVQDETHPRLRTDPPARAAIIAFVAGLQPDYVLCRSADLETTRAFPGVVRHLTEGAADPLALQPRTIHFTASPFDHGLLPALDAGQTRMLERLIAPHWSAIAGAVAFDADERARFREWAGLPDDRAILCLPLEYEHEENFFTIHRIGARPNAALVAEIASVLGDEVFLALTNHPLNELHVDNTALHDLARAHADRMVLLPPEKPQPPSQPRSAPPSASPGSPASHGAPHRVTLPPRQTWRLLREADGVILGDSKVFAVAGLIGTPIVRRSRFASGDWLNAMSDLAAFAQAVAQGTAPAPDRARAPIWFAYHVANNLVWPGAPDLTGEELLAQLARPFDPARWERNFDRFAAAWTLEPA